MTFEQFLLTIPMNISERHNAKSLMRYSQSKYFRTVYKPHAKQIQKKLEGYSYFVSLEDVFLAAETNTWNN